MVLLWVESFFLSSVGAYMGGCCGSSGVHKTKSCIIAAWRRLAAAHSLANHFPRTTEYDNCFQR